MLRRKFLTEINQTGTSRTTNWWQVGELRINCLP